MALIFLTEKLNGVKLRKGVTMSKIEIRQVEGEKIFTEICIDGHKIDGVRGYELKQDKVTKPIRLIELFAG